MLQQGQLTKVVTNRLIARSKGAEQPQRKARPGGRINSWGQFDVPAIASRQPEHGIEDLAGNVEISNAELNASIQGWINHVGNADSWGLRRHVLETLAVRPAEHRRAVEAR